MEGVLWYVFASSRGGPTRTQILRALDEQPRNANQLADLLELDYTTIRHHLDVLQDNSVVCRTGDGYGDVYLLTDQAEDHREILEEIPETVDTHE